MFFDIALCKYLLMFASRLRIFHSDGDVTKTGKWKTSARSLWPEGSLYHRSTILCIVGDSTFVCLFVRGFSSNSKYFHTFEDAIIADEGLKIFTYAWHLWPLSSEGSLAYHTYYDTGHPFKMIVSEDLWHSHMFSSGAVITCFNDICLVVLYDLQVYYIL